MTVAGMIGLSLLASFVLGTIVLAVVRSLVINWCPACSGSGCEAQSGLTLACTACNGSGVLRIPSHVPATWGERESEIA
jgi:DnaJ-class molecular chaperone